MSRKVVRTFSNYMNNEEYRKSVVWNPIEISKDNNKVVNVVPEYREGKFAVFDDNESHTLCIAETGAGKTHSVLVPYALQCVNARQSMVINDCKQELLPILFPYLEAQGFDVKILNFHDLSMSPDTYNPLQVPFELYKRGEVGVAEKLVRNLSNNLFKGLEDDKDPYFPLSAISCFRGAASILMREAEHVSQCTLKAISSLVVEMQKKMVVHNPKNDDYGLFGMDRENISDIYFKNRDKTDTEYLLFSSLTNNAADTARCVESLFHTCLEPYVTGLEIEDFLMESSFDIAEFGKKPTVVFVQSSDYESAYDPIVVTFLEQIYSVLAMEADGSKERKLDVPIHFILDEFSNLPQIYDMDKKISTARSRNIRFFLVLQSLAGLRQSYKKDISQAIISNCNMWVYLRSNEREIQEMIQQRLGMVTYPSGKSEPLVNFAELNSMSIGEVLFVYKGRPCFRKVMDYLDMKLPFEPLPYYQFGKRDCRKRVDRWSLEEHCYRILANETGLTVDQLKGKEMILDEEGVPIDKMKRLRERAESRAAKLRDDILNLELDEEDDDNE